MSVPTEQMLKEFGNSLQLSIKTKIVGARYDKGDVVIKFDSRPKPDDANLHKFLKTFEGKWVSKQKEARIPNANDVNWPKVTLFLLLTRMNAENIRKLSEDNPDFADIAAKTGVRSCDKNINSLKSCSQRIFEKVKEKRMTIRGLSETTGLSQVSIQNFKVGNDIKLSNLLKIIKALGLGLKIK